MRVGPFEVGAARSLGCEPQKYAAVLLRAADSE